MQFQKFNEQVWNFVFIGYAELFDGSGSQTLKGCKLDLVDYLMDGLSSYKISKSFADHVDCVKMGTTLEEGTDQSWFGGLGWYCCHNMKRGVVVDVPTVWIRSTLDQKFYDIDGWEGADRVTAHTGTFSGTGQMKWCGAIPTPGIKLKEVEDGLLDTEHLIDRLKMHKRIKCLLVKTSGENAPILFPEIK